MSSTLSPKEVLAYCVEKAEAKVSASTLTLLILGFLGGAFIAVGYLAYIRIVGYMPGPLSGLGKVLGAAVFPVGLIAILVGGGELITGNMMVVPTGYVHRRFGWSLFLRNWALVTLSNIVGAFFVAYFFGHLLGLTEGSHWEVTLHVAESKVSASFLEALISGVGCNWLVCMGLWLCYASPSMLGKSFGAWFPVMTFVAIGFQHVVANMFVIPAAIFGGAAISWLDFGENMLAVYLGNMLGGGGMVGLLYFFAYRDKATMTKEEA